MATGESILSYQENGLAGLGANASIPVSGNEKLDAVNEAGRNAMLLGVEQQRQLFQQKVRDHDKLLSLLDSGDLKVGDMLDRDRPVVKNALDSVDVAFANRAKKGFNDIDATVDYNKAVRKAKDTITQAQARYVVDKQVQQQASTELPSERESILKDHGNYLSSFWNDYTPHVKAITIDHPGMTSSILRDSLVPNSGVNVPNQTVRKTITKNVNGKLTTVDVETNQPVKSTGKTPGTVASGNLLPFTNVPGKYYDYGKMVANASDDFHDERQRLNQSKYMDFVLNQTDPAQLKGILDQANNRIDTYNKQRGFNEGTQGYVTPLEIVVAPDGSRHTNLSVPEFNAKLALASVAGDYVEQDKTAFDKDQANAIQQQKELNEKIRHDKATEGVDWAKYNLEKTKFNEGTKGAEDSKNAALVFANGLFSDLSTKGTKGQNGSVVLTPDQLRSLTTEQLRYLGSEAAAKTDLFGEKTAGGLQPLELKENEIIQLNPNGDVLVMKNAKFDPKSNTYVGKWDNTRSTSVWNAARNVLNEENQKSGTKERNAYLPIDLRNKKAVIQVDKSGGATTKSGTLIFSDGSKIDLNQNPLTPEEIQAAIKAGAKQQ